ncbi:MAG: tRNA (adenosine(37)-N6)-threonylcarbamoyltransferase complex ATPase subunit type 1 TsaE [Bacteroidetes bacterium 24-39-8]|jgi:tRNA threonylcarbamoyladenosine biosynthesis protein TsaE|nr:MAG: tRNA (adenosine(37)-N6)-threonylcarbamoyltransferase complex ATPase subunit type 1 TsaE [Sphingobacteriia bacterium 35-40-8]OYZ52340.1 MAG: tRNA (adenosine(37)-N6)-threonylcarbamoyltransferase complex ATPase subunit type 1 TsaE [Bacteroidetes bacterium 24-39-8]OZA65701.1 MAG: tRNA (adenosine(37)-N6)-threonylcarbamoyltransferase complex ATPase subunit type 1 TsaE [Sphingobacteriia bacterium 39-39-8]HQR92746.1 tRNA (adenosine(37)-N6)-threonylcarbamoyltransferase complex ATPase subunit type
MDAIFELEQIGAVAKVAWKEGKKHKVWIFRAPMGTGKTSFIHALCQELGVENTVSSPSYGIINEYLSREAGTIYHMDWYRLKSEEEAIQAGVEDALDSGNLCLIEWPEKAEGLLPENCFELHMEVLDQKMRRLYTENE